MLLAKLKELRALEAERAEAKADAPPPKIRKRKKLKKRVAERDAANVTALRGWAKVRAAGLAEARRVIEAREARTGDVGEGDGCARRLRGHAGPVICAVVSPDETRLFTGSADGDVRAWDHLREGRCELIMSGHSAAVCALAVDPTGERIFSAGADNVVRAWELHKGTCLRATTLLEMSHTDKGAFRRLDTANDPHASSSDTIPTRLAYSTSFAASPKAYSVSLGANAKVCFCGSSDGTVKCWDVATGTLRASLTGHNAPVGAVVAFHTTRTRIVTGGGDGTIRGWDLEHGACDVIVEAHAGATLALYLTKDDRALFSAGADGVLREWRVSCIEGVSGTLAIDTVRMIERPHGGAIVRCVVASEFSDVSLGGGPGIVFTGGEDGTIRAWSRAHVGNIMGEWSECVAILRGHRDWVSGLAIDTRGQTLCTASHDGSVLVWRVGRLTRRR